MDEYGELIRQRSQYKKVREEKYKSDSQNRLGIIVKKKIQTTMIGALSSIEEHFGFLWETEGEMTPEQQTVYDIYQTVRSEILDKGNAQARNLDSEISQYDISWNRYSIEIPIKTNGRNE